MDPSFYLNILTIIILIIGYFLIKNLFPSYFNEKGKNLARKEDIEEITEKVKTVESQLNVVTGNLLDYSTLKRQHIIDYFSAYNAWERTITSAKLDTSSDCEKRNEDVINRMYDAKHFYNLKEGEIELFIDDKEFYELRKELTIKTLKYQHEFERVATEIKYIIEDKNANYRNKLLEITSNYNDYRVAELENIYTSRKKLIFKLSDYIVEMTTKN